MKNEFVSTIMRNRNPKQVTSDSENPTWTTLHYYYWRYLGFICMLITHLHTTHGSFSWPGSQKKHRTRRQLNLVLPLIWWATGFPLFPPDRQQNKGTHHVLSRLSFPLRLLQRVPPEPGPVALRSEQEPPRPSGDSPRIHASTFPSTFHSANSTLNSLLLITSAYWNVTHS